MRTDISRIGDVVVIEVARENREWGFNPCADGTHAVILGFSEIYYGRTQNFGTKPGVYANHFWPKLRIMETGQEFTLCAAHLSGLVDVEEQKRRCQQPYQDRNEFLRELPETPFWESDVVRGEGRQQVVTRVNYGALQRKTDNGSPWPVYEVSDPFDNGGFRSFPEESLTLVRRGPVWNILHGIPVVYGSLEEEAKLQQSMGFTQEVKNPASGDYAWTKDEVLAALRDGIAHGFTVGDKLFGAGITHSAIRFDDVELGQRVAALTLSGFGV